MSREILFRGKRTDNGEWINDSETYIRDGDGIWLSDEDLHVVTVQEDTVGQYTGLTDKNGVKIYEGDIVRAESKARNNAAIYTAKFSTVDFCFGFGLSDGALYALNELLENELGDEIEFEVIGNIYDNPELLEGVRNE